MVFKGVATALLTPFKDNNVDFDSLDILFEKQLESGVNAVVIAGTTGEPATLSDDEKEAILKFAVNRLKGKIPVIAGAGNNSTQSAVRAARLAEDLGADAILVVTPYYNKCTQEGLFQHYSAIAKAASLPIICYNVPSRTGVNMLPVTFRRIAEIDNVVAIKEASGNMAQIADYLRLCTMSNNQFYEEYPDIPHTKSDDKRVFVYSGDDALTVPIAALGGDGVISVLSNILPAEVVEMTNAALDGDFEKAAKLQLDLLPLINALFSEVNPIPVKRAAELMGLCRGDLRLPLTRMSDPASRALERELKKFIRS